MLISSPRHTRSDLTSWRSYEEGDIIHAQSQRLRERQAESLNALIAFIVGKPRPYLSVSWGKDSVVCAHLLWCVDRQVPLVYLRPHPTANPDCAAVRDAFLVQYPLPYYERTPDWTEPGSSFEGEWRAVERDFGNRHISGVRAEESGGRKIRMRRWGLESANACAPIGWWSVGDVFGYLSLYNLPIHPAYAMLGGGRWQRDTIRVDELGVVEQNGRVRERRGERGGGFGAGQWEREYYGDVLRLATH